MSPPTNRVPPRRAGRQQPPPQGTQPIPGAARPALVVPFRPRPYRPALEVERLALPWWESPSFERWFGAAVLVTLGILIGVQIGIRQGRELERLEHPVAIAEGER